MSYYEQFVAGRVPNNIDLEGEWAVHGLYGPLPLRLFGHKKCFQKTSENKYKGVNRFLSKIDFGYFEASVGTSQLEPKIEVININYDVDATFKVMRGLTDEVRFVSKNKMLGRGVYAPPALGRIGPKNIFWFTVTRL